jgi:hypothetical protein
MTSKGRCLAKRCSASRAMRRRVNDEMSSSATITLRSQLGHIAQDHLLILSVEFAHRAQSSGHALVLAA